MNKDKNSREDFEEMNLDEESEHSFVKLLILPI